MSVGGKAISLLDLNLLDLPGNVLFIASLMTFFFQSEGSFTLYCGTLVALKSFGFESAIPNSRRAEFGFHGWTPEQLR